MPTSISEIHAHLAPTYFGSFLGEPEGDQFQLVLPTHSYVNEEGSHGLQVVVRVAEGGGHVEAFVPRAYNANTVTHKQVFLEALARAGCYGRYTRVALDATDGEVRLLVDQCVLDGSLTSVQVLGLVMSVFMAVEEMHEVLVHAGQTGEIDFDRRLSVREPDVYGDDGEGDDETADHDGEPETGESDDR